MSPLSAELFSHYRDRQSKYTELADKLSIPRLSRQGSIELCALLGSSDATELVEAVARLHNYGDTRDHADMRKAVSRLLKKRGIRLSRGKRTRPELERLVDDMVPLLLYLGVRLASSERSHLVRVLRLLADEFGVRGDPRDELRRVIARDRAMESAAKKAIYAAIARGLESFSSSNG